MLVCFAARYKNMLGNSNTVRCRPLRQLCDEDKEFIHESFKMADCNNKGYLRRDELKVAMTALYGYRPSKHEVNDLLQKVGKLEKNVDAVEDISRGEANCILEKAECRLVLDQDTFMNVMNRQIECTDRADDIRETFQYFDSRCKGFVEFKDFEQKVRSFLPHSQEQTLIRAFRELDTDGDGRISFRDFEFMMERYLY